MSDVLNLVGLKGFGFSYGVIGRYFDAGWFPYSFDWRAKHKEWVMREYRRRYGMNPYLLVGFSDGGTLAHEIAAEDPWCEGVIIHSGMFRSEPEPHSKPILLLCTAGDRTPTYRETFRALNYYDDMECDVSIAELLPTHGHFKHQFANGLASMFDWTMQRFDHLLPVKQQWLEYAAEVPVHFG